MESIETRTTTKVKAIAPECYGSGEIKVPLRFHEGAYNWARVDPKTCFSCPFERRCLRQQARTRLQRTFVGARVMGSSPPGSMYSGRRLTRRVSITSSAPLHSWRRSWVSMNSLSVTTSLLRAIRSRNVETGCDSVTAVTTVTTATRQEHRRRSRPVNPVLA